MIDLPLDATEDEPQQVVQPGAFWPRFWTWLGLSVVMLASIFMNFYQLGQNGFGNAYYAAGVRSMADNLHNFFFVSFDPGGFVTIDKPPLGLWLQVASVKVFGFTPFAIFFPQALAGVFSVLLLYYLVRRHFGVIAGLLAALALALSPISVVTNRNNTIDSTLVLVMLLGAWAVIRAAETGRLRWLLLCAVFVGLGFNIKMLEAYLVVPAYGLLYLLAAPKRWWVRVTHLVAAGVLMAVISLAWVTTVDLIPASQRPYVGSSQNNSELSLALGYNGLQRLEGNTGGGGVDATPGGGQGDLTGNGPGPDGPQPPNGGNDNGPGFRPPTGGTGLGTDDPSGNPGLLRLFTQPLGGQIAWLLPLAILGVLALLWQGRRRVVEGSDEQEGYARKENGPVGRLRRAGQWFFSRFCEDREQQSLVLWGMWLLAMGVFYSVAVFFHQYYLSTFAPAIAAMFGIGLVVMWRDYRNSGWRGWLLPVALLLTAAEQIYLIETDPTWGTWLIPLIAIPCLVAALVLFVARALQYFRFPTFQMRPRVLATALCLGLAALLLTPAVWSAIPGLENITQDLPIAGAGQQDGGSGSGDGTLTIDAALISYLEAHQGSAKYLVAVVGAREASTIILGTNRPVMALGGFTGKDPILTTSQLVALIANGTVHYFLIGGRGGGDQGNLTGWVTSNCTAVPSNEVSTSRLYYCSGA